MASAATTTLVDSQPPARPPAPTAAQVRELQQELSHKIQGEVRFDNGSRALYATDGSNYRQVPIGVVIPLTVDDVVETVALCRKFDAPVLSRGGGTSLAGQCCNVAVVMDFTKYLNRLVELDPQRKRARVQPGCVLDTLRNAAERHHLTFGPDPSTHSHCTLGGMIGNNSCGMHSVMAGKTDENVEELEILLYDGTRMRVGKTDDNRLRQVIAAGGRRAEIYQRLSQLRDHYAEDIRGRYPHIPRRVSGYNLPWLLPERNFDVAKALVGSEGTCITILEATVRLVWSPPSRVLLVLAYPSVYSAGDHVKEVSASKPIGLEGLDDRLLADMKESHLHADEASWFAGGKGWLLAEFGAETQAEAISQAESAMQRLAKLPDAPNMRLFTDPEQQRRIAKMRAAGLGATAHIPGKKLTWEGWEDSAVPSEQLGHYLRDLQKLFDKYDYEAELYGHFGQGCVHTRISFDLQTDPGIAKYRSFVEAAADLVVAHGGSFSGEHGDGQSRAELLPKMYGEKLIRAFEEFKAIWDPDWKMNPGKIVRPYRIDENLRPGSHYNPQPVKTHFQFTEDGGDFNRVSLRCVGIGDCRKAEGGTMCPSYMVTREEMHSTRGRAHLLFEMLQGNPLKEGWKSEAVKEALDLCLACKGCKSDCPVHVDMATYKSEFLSHYYEGRLRPRQAYAMGWIYWWARLASRTPRFVNFVSATPVLSGAVKWLGGISPQRKLPQFATQTFKQWFRERTQRNQGFPSVILWADTFCNHFHPEIAVAAVEVLEEAGFCVQVPQESLCCGRPLYDFGMLDTAKKQLQEILQSLRSEIENGVPVVGLEPSCVAVFRDEMKNLFPRDQEALRLSQQVFLLSEFLVRKAPKFEFPKLRRKALVHYHCHHKSALGSSDEKTVLEKLGLDFQILDSGCCGMAGSFGFETDHYDVSVACGERVLLPEVRKSPQSTLLIADGFSCREQIVQCTGRKALHLAEVIQLALHARAGTNGRVSPDFHAATQRNPYVTAAIVACGTAALGGIGWWMLKRRRSES